MNKIIYICQLSTSVQTLIKQQLAEKGINKEGIKMALNSRLCDLEDTIEINNILKEDLL